MTEPLTKAQRLRVLASAGLPVSGAMAPEDLRRLAKALDECDEIHAIHARLSKKAATMEWHMRWAEAVGVQVWLYGNAVTVALLINEAVVAVMQ